MLLWLPVTQGLVFEFSDSADEAAPSYTDSQVKIPDFSKVAVVKEIIVLGYESKSFVEPHVVEFMPAFHWVDSEELATRELIERQGVWLYLTQCAKLLTDYPTYYGAQSWDGFANYCSSGAVAIRDYYTENNYAHPHSVLNGSLLES